jgi:hypothetical protein
LIGNGSSLSLPQRSNSCCLIFRREITMSVQLETETVRNRNALAVPNLPLKCRKAPDARISWRAATVAGNAARHAEAPDSRSAGFARKGKWGKSKTCSQAVQLPAGPLEAFCVAA